MADFVLSFRDGLLTLVDGTTPTPVSLVVLDAEGDLSVKVAREFTEVFRRGMLDEIKRGDTVPIEWSTSFKFRGVEGVPTASSTSPDATGIGDTSIDVQVADFASFSTTGEGIIGPDNGSGADQVAERFSWTGKSGNQLTGCTRGTNGTDAKSWLAGATIRQIDLSKRTMVEFMLRRGGYSGLVGTRAGSDVFTFDLWASFNDVDGAVAQIASLNDAYVTSVELAEGDPSSVSVSGKAWAAVVQDIALP